MIESSGMTSSVIPAYQMKGLGLVNITVKFALNNIRYFGSLVRFFEAWSFCNFCRLDFFQKSFASVGFVGADQVTLKANALEAWDPRTNWSYPSLAQDLFVRASV